MVSLCHGLIPNNSSHIVIACINMMRMIGIDSQMIAKHKTWILLYKDFVLSLSHPLRTNNEFKLRMLIYHGFTVFLMLFLMFSVSKSLFVLIFMYVSLYLQEICLKNECGGFRERNTEKYHLRSL